MGCFCRTPAIGEAVQRNDQRPVTGLYVMQMYVADLGVAIPKVAALVQHDRSLCADLYRFDGVGNSMWL
jgi:hypothetical protein